MFDSGWEWGAWLSTVVACRAAWRPAPSFRDALAPAEAVLGTRMAELIANLTSAQHRLLILGETADGYRPTEEQLRHVSGFAYLSGRSAWTDLLGDVGVAVTQPARIGPRDHRHPLYGRVAYLLSDMNSTFSAFARSFAAAAAAAPHGRDDGPRDRALVAEVAEIVDATAVLALRADFVAAL